MLRTLPLLLLGLVLQAAPVWGGEPARLGDGTTIPVTASLTLAEDRYVRPDPEGDGVLVIETDGVTVDLGGATLVGNADPDALPNAYTGIAIHVKNAKNVTIQNGVIRGYKIGIRAEKAYKLRLIDIDASHNFRQRLYSTPEREDLRDWLRPHDNDNGEWEAKYGAGFSLNQCEMASVRTCTVRKGQNGLLLTRCKTCDVTQNDFSFNSGWGIALYRTTQCRVERNTCDWCVRGYSHGVYHRGQDSAGILVFEQCHFNRFSQNSATHGGDGFFLYAGHDTTERTGAGGSNRNVVLSNDFSHAVANGIEATFSQGNRFLGNDVSDSDHGFWLGYSYDTLVAGNRAIGCMSAGVSIEHGHNNTVVTNTIEEGRIGVHLWWDDDKAFIEGVYGQTHDTSSSRNLIQRNVITDAETAIRLGRDTGTKLQWNTLGATQIALDLGKGTRTGAIRENRFQGSHGARPEDPKPPTLIRNHSGAAFELPGTNRIAGRFRPVPPGFGARAITLADRVDIEDEPPKPFELMQHAGPPEGVALPKDHPRGRDQIRIDEWGPLDPTESAVFPKFVRGGSEATFHVLGSGAFTTQCTGGVKLEPQEGTAPATITVRPASQQGGVFPFSASVSIGDQTFDVAGVLVATTWDVRYYEWNDDPRESDDTFARLVAGAPKSQLMSSSLDFPWRSDGPDGVRADRFATVATTTLPVTKGRYRVRSVSDDGIRVYVNGKRVIDNWTHHAPTEDLADIDLEAGDITLRVEHFEIDGWAHLEVTLEPLPN